MARAKAVGSSSPLPVSSDAVMPGSLGLDALWQLVGFYLGWVGFSTANDPGTGRTVVQFSFGRAK